MEAKLQNANQPGAQDALLILQVGKLLGAFSLGESKISWKMADIETGVGKRYSLLQIS